MLDSPGDGSRVAPVPMVGRSVGQYRILGKLGRGGMGTVWKARSEVLARTVALKFLPEELADSPRARQRLIREARAASRLKHDGVATVYETGEVAGQLYLVTEYVNGCTLREKLAAGVLPVAEAVRIACAVARALGHAHDHGVIHRDVSSANIMVAPDGHVTVIDFGLARLPKDASSQLTPSGAMVGTVPYIAPELLRNREADRRTDLYALGVVLYEMLTGTPPFQGQAFETIVNAILNQAPEPPSRRRPDVPSRLDRVVLKTLAKEPARRYSSALAMIRDLGGLRFGESTAVRITPPTIAATRSRERPRRATRSASRPSVVFLAVTPFKDASPPGRRRPRAQAFARGLAETVSARLASVPGVHVIPPSALPADRASVVDLMTLERDLGVNLVLTGSVQWVGQQIRLGFSLVGRQRVQLAGDTLDGSMREILFLEDQLVRRIASSLELDTVSLAPLPQEVLSDPAAHEHYLQALGCLQRYENEASVDGAIRLLERLTKSDGANARVHAVLGRAYLAKYRLTFEPEWKTRAAAACRKALKVDPELPEVLRTLGDLQRETGRYQEAVTYYRRALRLRPDDPGTFVDLAWTYELSGVMAKAEEALREAVALCPSYWSTHNKLGVLYFKQARYEEAAKAWERVIHLTPDNARGHFNLGAAYYHLGRYAEAIAAYERSLEIRPDATAYTSLGTVYFFLGDRERAVRVLEKGRNLRPSNPRVWGNLADAYRWARGLEDKAGPAFDRAIALKRKQLALNKRDGKGWAELGNWLAKRGRFKQAVRAIQRGLGLVPHDVNCMAHAVRVFHLVGDREAALKWLEKAVLCGYDVAELERDPDLATLRGDPRFERIVKGRRARPSGT